MTVEDEVIGLRRENEELKARVALLTNCVVLMAKETGNAAILEKFPPLNSLPTAPVVSNAPVAPSPEKGILMCQNPYDTNGLLYHIGTDFGKHKWENPFTTKAVKVNASSIKEGRVSQVVDCHFKDQVFFTNSELGSWIVIDLLKYKIKPTHYRMAHRARSNEYFMRNWELHASNDPGGKDWWVMSRHVNDEQINEKNMIGSWPINKIGTHYRYFRIVITGHNSKNTHALVCSCFDIYGEYVTL